MLWDTADCKSKTNVTKMIKAGTSPIQTISPDCQFSERYDIVSSVLLRYSTKHTKKPDSSLCLSTAIVYPQWLGITSYQQFCHSH